MVKKLLSKILGGAIAPIAPPLNPPLGPRVGQPWFRAFSFALKSDTFQLEVNRLGFIL